MVASLLQIHTRSDQWCGKRRPDSSANFALTGDRNEEILETNGKKMETIR